MSLSLRWFRSSWIFLFLLLIHPSTQASSDMGFEITKGRFSMQVRWSEMEDEAVDAAASDEPLLFECMRWVAANAEELRTKDAGVTVWVNVDELTIQIEDEEVATPFKPGEAFNAFRPVLERKLSLKRAASVLPEKVELVVVRSKEYIEDGPQRTDIYSGAIPGSYTLSAEDEYLLLLWPDTPLPNWAKDLKKTGARFSLESMGARELEALLYQ